MKDVSGEGRTVLFVSHNMEAVRKLCTNGLMMKHGQVHFTGNIQETIQKYNQRSDIMDYTQNIPDDFSTYNTGEAKFRKISIINSKNESVTEVLYKSPIKVLLELEIFREIPDAILDIKICSTEGENITFSCTTFEGIEKIHLTKGLHQFECVLDNHLVPNSYAFTIGIHYSRGDSIDYIERIYPFTILKMAENKSDDYNLPWTHGYMVGKSSWKHNPIFANSF